MMICVIVMKGGAEIRIPCDRFHIVNDTFTGKIKEIKFYNPAESELVYINPDEVTAVYKTNASEKEGEADG